MMRSVLTICPLFEAKRAGKCDKKYFDNFTVGVMLLMAIIIDV